MYPKKIYLTRHGETDYNKNKIVQGGTINAPLNDTGLTQAQLFSEAFKEEKFGHIITSTLIRTHQSVNKFIEKNIPLTQEAGLNEISWGKYDGTPLFDNQYYWDTVESWKKGETDLKIENGESPQDVYNRQIDVIKRFKEIKTERVLVCMHGRAMRILLCNLLELPLIQMDNFKHANLGLYIIKFDGTKFTLEKENYTEHLNKQ